MIRFIGCASVILMLADGNLLAQFPPAGETAAKVPPANQPTWRTHKVKISFARDSLQHALELLSKDIGVPIEIEVRDLQAEGITKNQAFSMPVADRTADEFVRTCLLKCNPDGKLAYVVRTDAQGVPTVTIVTRKGAAQRGETVFADFTLMLTPAKPEAADRGPWSQRIRAATIESEVRRQIAALGEALKAKPPGRTVRTAVAELAVLFRVIDQYDGKVRWKSEAGRIWGDLGNHLPPRDDWDDSMRQQTGALHDDLQKLLKNDKWPRSGTEPVQLTWQQIAPRTEIMQRLEHIYQKQLANWTGQEENQPAARAELQHQAEIIATLAHIIGASSYEYADDKAYADSAKALEQQAKTIAAAAASKRDDAALKLEINRLQKTCSECHANFR